MTAVKYLEQNSTVEEDEYGEAYETVSIHVAHTAIKLAELEALVKVFLNNEHSIMDIDGRITQLKKELKHIKIK